MGILHPREVWCSERERGEKKAILASPFQTFCDVRDPPKKGAL
jgi:hypothetical protein